MGSHKFNVSHLQFADDTLILAEGDENNVKVLKSLIQRFEMASRFKVNWVKNHLLGISLQIQSVRIWQIFWDVMLRDGLPNTGFTSTGLSSE